MKPCFSLKYNGTEIHSSQMTGKSTPDGMVYTLDKIITVTVQSRTFDKYDAIHWVLYFENKSDCNSGIISDINDCDTLFVMNLPSVKQPGYMPKVGDACIITMTGMVEGVNYWENDKVSATEYTFNYEYLDKVSNKTKSFQNIGGRSSEGMMPFFDIEGCICRKKNPNAGRYGSPC